MSDMLGVFTDPDLRFLRLAFYLAALASVAFGVMGSYVVTRRISYLAGAVAHCVFGGIGAGLYLRHKTGIEWFDPIYGAAIAAVIAAVVIGLVSMYAQQREDTVIGALWAVGMAAGLLFVDLTPGYYDLTSYLFGDILLISSRDVWLVAFLDIVIVAFSTVFYNRLVAVCFDEDFARLRGVHAGAFYIILLCLTALTVVVLVRMVGIILVIALLTLPAAIAGQFAKKIWHMMVAGTGLCLLFNWAGLGVSYSLNLSSAPTIIMIAGVVYLSVIAAAWMMNRWKTASVYYEGNNE
ncbi:MAG: metal ABC transporter permease [Thermodesulfobacteriota bacterium]|nr:metal ABC transporter permease [Thermodesulfobacteriota bacterium]